MAKEWGEGVLEVLEGRKRQNWGQNQAARGAGAVEGGVRKWQHVLEYTGADQVSVHQENCCALAVHSWHLVWHSQDQTGSDWTGPNCTTYHHKQSGQTVVFVDCYPA